MKRYSCQASDADGVQGLFTVADFIAVDEHSFVNLFSQKRSAYMVWYWYGITSHDCINRSWLCYSAVFGLNYPKALHCIAYIFTTTVSNERSLA